MRRVVLIGAWALPVLIAALVAWTLLDDSPEEPAPNGAAAMFRHVIHWGLWRGRAAVEAGPGVNGIARADLRPGDVLLCRTAGTCYGTYSHAGVVVGQGQALGADILAGLFLEPVDWLSDYDEITVLRPGTPEQGERAAAAARALVGRPFALHAHPQDPGQFSCGKAAVVAWRNAGVELGDGSFWPSPDAIAAGSHPVISRWVKRGIGLRQN